jgi:hypothetical protein
VGAHDSVELVQVEPREGAVPAGRTVACSEIRVNGQGWGVPVGIAGQQLRPMNVTLFAPVP